MSQYLYKYYNIEMEHTQDCLNPTAHLKKNDIMSCSDLEYPLNVELTLSTDLPSCA